VVVVALHGTGCGGPIAGPEARGGGSLGTSTAAGGAATGAGAAGGGLAASGAPGAWRSCLVDGASPCISDEPVRLDRDLLAWSDWIGDYTALHGHKHTLGVTECRWVAELEQVLLCGSYDRSTMNPPLTRAAIFVEVRAHSVIDRGDPFYSRYTAAVGGFDLLKDHPDPARPDLLHFYAAVDRACAADGALCADEPERAMRALLERAWAGKPKFVLVTFAHRGPISDDEVVSHEILHAQYFTTPAYRDAIDAYWKGLTRPQRDEVRATLAGIYNVNDEELMQNEFQAYVLMSGADRARLYGFLDEHRAAMLERLAARGVQPIAVQRRAP
jgi:hypothetical protein